MSKPFEPRNAKGVIRKPAPEQIPISPKNANRHEPEKIVFDVTQLDMPTDPSRLTFIATVTCSTTRMVLASAVGENAPFAALELYMGLMNSMRLPGGSGAQT